MQCASEWLFARSRPAKHTLISIYLEQWRMNPWPAALAAAVCVCVCARAKNRGNVRLQRPLGHLCWVRRRLNYPHFNCAVCACRSESAGREEADRRDAAELEDAHRRDPIERLAGELTRDGLWAASDREVIDAAIDREVEGSIAFARNSRRPDPASALDFMYAATYPDFPAKGWEA